MLLIHSVVLSCRKRNAVEVASDSKLCTLLATLRKKNTLKCASSGQITAKCTQKCASSARNGRQDLRFGYRRVECRSVQREEIMRGVLAAVVVLAATLTLRADPVTDEFNPVAASRA